MSGFEVDSRLAVNINESESPTSLFPPELPGDGGNQEEARPPDPVR